MSLEFGNILHRLTKIVFFNDNIDLSKQFEEVKCKKLIIWDYCDEVIPDKASLKGRLINKKRRNRASASSNNND